MKEAWEVPVGLLLHCVADERSGSSMTLSIAPDTGGDKTYVLYKR